MSSILGSHSKSKSVQQSVANSQQTSMSNSDAASLSNSVSNANSASSSTSHTGNQAFDLLNQTLSPAIGQTAQSGNFIAQLLGLQGDNGADAAFNKYLDSTGYKFNLDQGSKAITDNAAVKGLLNSGSTLKALSTYGQNTGASYFNNFLQQLLGLGKQGTDAASVLSGAGGVSDSSSNSTSNQNSTSNSGTVQSSSSVGQGTSGSVSSGVSGTESGSGIGGFTGILLNNLMGKGVG